MKRNLLIAFVLLIFWCSCNQGRPHVFNGPKIKSFLRGSNGIPAFYHYDKQGRIDYIGRGKNVERSYTYTGNQVTCSHFDFSAKAVVTDTLFLNTNGVEDSGIYTFIRSKYFTDSGGAITHIVSYETQQQKIDSTILEYLNGDVVSEYNTGASAPLKIYYTYYPDKVNTIGNANMGKFFEGKSSIHPVKVQFGLFISGGDTVEKLYHHYAFDDKERIIKQVLLFSPTDTFTQFFYTYY